ncbi:putative ABC transport system permease protein [Algoriphagus faecimaris]|uniref:Putative ABC transport system permease protein n=1 Tax=Algoriphagus faecimaris TaxID=686796 RepID=A0A1G6S8W4_9BACT|nr:FtsX-like permease family protein [Algoriphagus faecimaris]SDD13362.1 putative ABC transport system permease protein [Algoriphagus faecimaris]
MPDFAWILKMALRDFRKNISRLLLFVSSIVVGIAALVAISSFGDNLTADIDNQAKELLGADLVLENNKPIDEQAIDTIATQLAQEVNFASMVAFPATGDSRLTQVRALEGDFPFYGKLETIPESGESDFRSGGQKALVEKVLMAQFDAQVGDKIKVGELEFEIAGELQGVPGQTGITATVAPAVYIPYSYLEATGLVQYGSRVEYNRYFQFEAGTDVEALIEPFEDNWEIDRIDADTVEDRKRSTGRSFGNLSNFLSLVAFIALLLGCVGVASAVNVFVKEKLASVAVLRCLGVSSRDVLLIYLFEIVVMGLVGAILGSILGTALQFILPFVFADFLPVEVSFSVSWLSVGFGIITGLFVSILFALLPLLKVRKVSPMATLRPEAAGTTLLKDPMRWLVVLGILLFIWGFSYYLLGQVLWSFGFTGFVVFAFALLWGVGQLIMWSVRKFLPITLRYTVRQALANLYRPNNQTISLIATIGLGTAMISTLFFLQNQLLEEAKFADKEDQPNLLMFDIQTPQLDAVRDKVIGRGLRILQEVPIVTMQLNEINGIDKRENEELPDEEDYSRWMYNREYRVTYRDTLTETETLVEGELVPLGARGDSIFVSLSESFGRGNNLKIGDEIEFNVQGRPIKTYVGSYRDVKFNQVSTNFIVLFPEGVLEQAPKFHVIITRTKNDRESAAIQSEVVREFPNISIVNLGAIVETLEDILNKISFVIQFMALFSIATGILVLISSLIISKYQRMRESILLRTLGADSGTVTKINTLEYFFLGSLASLSGIILSFLATWMLSAFVFEMNFRPAWGAALGLYASITLLTIVLGWLNGRKIINQPPMEILRGNG